MTPQEHAALLRELENVARHFGDLMTDFADSEEAHEAHALQERARAAAEELEALDGFIADQQPLPAETAAILSPEARWELYTESDDIQTTAEVGE